MISAYVVVITRGADGEAGVVVHGGTPGEVGDVLVLCRRSGRTRNGWGTFSATAGGVVELDQTAVRLDTDDLGCPSIEEAVLRETTEELGLVRDARRVVPDEADAITAAAPAWAVPGRRWTRA